MAQSLVPIPITSSGPTPWIDVKAYGAKGDGANDDCPAIQGAINACPANGIFNNPGVQNAQTMFGDAITLGASMASPGILSSPSQNTGTAKSLSFLFNAPNGETITPEGFIVEAIQ